MVGIWTPAHVAVTVPPGATSAGVTVTWSAGTPGPPALIFATKASPHGPPKKSQTPPPMFGWKAPGVVGKSYDWV